MAKRKLSESGIPQAKAIELLRLHNPNLSFQGFADTGTATPSHTANNAWIITESGTVFGTDDCVQGQVIYSDGSAFVVNTFKSLSKKVDIDKFIENKYVAFTANTLLNQNGTVSGSSNFSVSDYLDVVEGDVLLFSGYGLTDRANICGYNSSYIFQSMLLTGGDYVYEQIIIPAGVTKIKVSSTGPSHATYPRTPFVGFYKNIYSQITDINNNISAIENEVVINADSVANLKKVYDIGYYSSYNNTDAVSSTTIINPLVLSSVGDYVEIELKYSGVTMEFANMLGLLSGINATDRFGYYSSSQFWLRVGSDSYSQWTGLTHDIRNWHKLKIIIVAGGWELFIDSVSKGVKIKASNFTISSICKTLAGLSTQKYDIKTIDIYTALNGHSELNQLALYAGSVNVQMIADGDAENESNPPQFLTWDSSGKSFKSYQQDKKNSNVYYMFKIALNSSVGTAENEIFYKHHWEIVGAKICSYNSSAIIMNEGLDLLAEGESESVLFYTGINGTKVDHTMGVHGDERIDVDSNSYVHFFVDGVKLSSTDLASSFTLLPCAEFKYAQRSSVHDTAEFIANKDTGLPAVGSGVLTINGTNHKFEIDAVDTGIVAYDQNGFLVSTTGLTVGVSASSTWTISSVREIVAGHPIVAEHFKETFFENQGYKTLNTLVFNNTRNVSYWYHGICCLHKNAAKLGYNEDFEEVEFTGSANNYLESNINRRLSAYNPTTKIACEIESEVLREGTDAKDIDAEMFIWDRFLDSKYYRKIPLFTPVIGEKIISKMIVKYSSM